MLANGPTDVFSSSETQSAAAIDNCTAKHDPQTLDDLQAFRSRNPKKTVYAFCPIVGSGAGSSSAGRRGAQPPSSSPSSSSPTLPRRLWQSLALAAGVAEGQTWAELSNAKLSALAQQLTACDLQVSMCVASFFRCRCLCPRSGHGHGVDVVVLQLNSVGSVKDVFPWRQPHMQALPLPMTVLRTERPCTFSLSSLSLKKKSNPASFDRSSARGPSKKSSSPAEALRFPLSTCAPWRARALQGCFSPARLSTSTASPADSTSRAHGQLAGSPAAPWVPPTRRGPRQRQ